MSTSRERALETSPAILVDCGCVAYVYQDRSGVEIEYCLLHHAAPDLLAAPKEMDALVESLWESVPWGQTFNLDVQALNEAPIHAKKAICLAEFGRAEGER